jgi:hypothetical protein
LIMDVTGFCRVDVDVVILPNRAPFSFRRSNTGFHLSY